MSLSQALNQFAQNLGRYPYLAEEFQIESTTANVWADDTSAHT